ncbi:MAG TPA: low molecular weight protein-tyrosine-phosphatase [Thermoanaerobaculia bacterium]|nr:low molecular weight protein-tyrosine-phosphatase [Thermoanaerobaculia bacterium]
MTTHSQSGTRRVLFVCLGNICRSPTGEGLLRALLAERGLEGRIEVDSAGTGAWHVGEGPDRRMAAAAAARGYRLGGRARQVAPQDYDRYDLIVAMDRENLADLEAMAPPPERRRAELRLFSEFLPPGAPRDVPDPYYGGGHGFERVLDLVEEGCAAILDHLLDGEGQG